MEHIPEVLFDLLAAKPYENLTHDEKVLVDGIMSPADYDAQYAIIRDFRAINDAVEVPPSRGPHQKAGRSPLMRALTYRIPLYQVAAGLAIVVASTIGFTHLRQPLPTQERTTVAVGQSLKMDNYPEALVFVQ